VYLLRARPGQNPAAPAGVRTTRVTVGTLEEVIRLSGTTAARNFANIAAPRMRGPDSGRALVLIHLAKAGSMVKEGELMVQIDAQAIKDHVEDVHASVVQAEADIRKRKAEQAIEMENLQQSLRVAKANLEKARLDASASEIRTSIDQELLKLWVEEADAEYKQLEKDLGITEQLHASQIRILEFTRDRHARHRDRHAFDVTRFTMNAPISGLVVMQSIWRGGEMGQVQLGDQVAPGQPFMKVVDTSSMQVDATVNQVESEQLRIGQPVVVGFDAFPDLRLKGKVSSIGAMAVGGWRQNYFIRSIPVKVDIVEQDPRVIPDLSASADVTVNRKPNVLQVPLEAVHDEAGKTFVWVKRGNSFEKRAVQLGDSSNTHAAVESGLRAGEEVALQPPAAHVS
jgi:multidrug efflux pump subunit AcrA (membrane-fusion protein)